MQAWCTAAFSSAYGSGGRGAAASATAVASELFDRRSCSPISGLREGEEAALAGRLLLRRRRGQLRRDLAREPGEGAAEVAPRLGEDGGLAAVDAELDGAVGRQLVADL